MRRAVVLALLLLVALTLAPARTAAAEPEGRYQAPLALGLRLGGLVAYSAPAGGAATAVGGGAYALFDQRSLLADVSADAWGGDKVFRFGGGLGVYWAAMPQANHSVYLGGGARLTYAKDGGEGAFGLTLHGAVGLLASRHWSPHVRLELAWFVDTFGEKHKVTGSRHNANGPMATLGLGF